MPKERYGMGRSLAEDVREIGKHLGISKRNPASIGSKNPKNREALEAAGELESGIGIRRDNKVRNK